ncbi:hypothetical protein E0Z10_g7299 [Xylaria hypoxylon]|uniref:Major facilitator superfamily (MFS) profile domain-containing protein n=1 Tax=Xylaria hypoxylon TaxID=37992 RepID=A0A4Z0YVI0_9PEZI|nr:hypothetical protein E0Z10_g7299 [Xylaria hypoxylon]
MDIPTTTSLRTTGSNPSLKPISNRTGSTRSATSHLGSYRHALLKSHAKPQQSIKKDLPVPPVLTDSHPIPTAQDSRPQEPATQTPTPIGDTTHPIEPVAPGMAGTDLREVMANDRQSSVDGYDHFRTWRLPVSKVRSAVYDIEEDGKVDVHEYTSTNSTPPEEVFSVDSHSQHSHNNTPKVRPSINASSIDASSPQGTKKTEQDSAVGPTHSLHSQGGEESHKVATYWGFLPGFGARQSKQRLVAVRQEDGQPTPSSRGGSSHHSHIGSRRSLTSVQPNNIASDLKQENIRKDETSSRGSGGSKDRRESRNVSISSGRQSGKSITLASRPSPPSPGYANANKGQEPLSSQKLDTGRTARWLRGLLGYSEADTLPTLTKLPEKQSPRQGSLDDVASIASRVTTYSLENVADKKAMNNAMRSMENTLTEALSLADEASKREYGHLDDGNLPLKSPSEISVYTPSVDESIRRGSSEHEGDMLAIPLPNTITEAVGSVDDEPKVSSLKSVKRTGFLTSIKRDGKIPRPSFLKRTRKATNNIENRYHTVDDDCVLPMPQPDRGAKKDCICPGPCEYDEDDVRIGITSPLTGVLNSREVRKYIQNFHQPPIGTRGSSKNPCETKGSICVDPDSSLTNRLSEIRRQDRSVCSLDGGISDEAIDFSTQYSTGEKRYSRFASFRGASRRTRDEEPAKKSGDSRKRRVAPTKHAHELRNVSLRNRSHVSIDQEQLFSLTKSARRQPTIARDWSPARKRFVAAVACISTALIGVLVGIYAGLVPSIQYYIADFHHYAILGNVGLYLGMALPNFFCWPLPLLHGRKPYIVGGLCIAMPLLFPQAIAIGTQRSPYTSVWRVALLLSRALMGFALGFAQMNFHSILTDLFGASLMSNTPHQEVVDEYDVRRHGGGLGVWLGIWTWCFIGSLGVGFLVGAVVIEHLQPSWGLYISIIIIAAVLLLNVLCPEVRRSAWRRSVAEVRMGETISRRLARGEVMMHRVQTGPRWWGQEVYHGVALSLEMLRQPGFTTMAVYSAWIYAQIILVIVLLGSLTSKSYRFRAPYVGAVVSSVAIGAFIAIPFQKANVFSRARNMNPKSNKTTFDKKISWSSHLVRRAIFTLVLPIAGIAYTAVSTGPPVHIFFPSVFAALIGFLSCLAISECNGMLMENWDCSDLQPGITGRSKSSKDSHKRTNYSSFPRATAGWNLIQSLGFVFAAGATGLGGSITRRLGQRTATGVVAGILFILTLLLLGTFIRFKRVQIIPECTCSEMDRWTKDRRVSHHNWAAAMAAAKEEGKKELNEIPEEDVG